MKRSVAQIGLNFALILLTAASSFGMESSLITGHLDKTASAEAAGPQETSMAYLEGAVDVLAKTARKPAEDEDRNIGLAAAEAFVSLAAWLEDEGVLAAGDQLAYYDKIASAAPAGTLKDLATHLQARSLAAKGNVKGAANLVSRMGIMRDFTIVGPFDNERGQAFSRSYPPEEKIDLTASYPGVRGTVTWRKISTGTYDGSVNLSDYLYPNQWTAAFLITRVEVAKEGDYILSIASDDGAVVWLDGVKCISDRARRPMTFDQDAVQVHLTEGTHDILVKSLQEKGDWTVRVRLNPIPGARLRDPVVKIHDGSAPTGTAKLVEGPLPADGVSIVDEILKSVYKDADGKRLRLTMPAESTLKALKEAGEDTSPGIALLLAGKKVAYWQGKLGGAVQEMQDHDAALLQFIKGSILGRRRVFDVYGQQDPVEEMYGEAAKLWPENAAVAYHHALSLFPVKEMEAEKNYNPFLKEMRRLLSATPAHTGALSSLALYYSSVGMEDRAYEYTSLLNEKSVVRPYIEALNSQQFGWNWEINAKLAAYGEKNASYLPGIRLYVQRLRSQGRLNAAYEVISNLLKRDHATPETWVSAFELMLASGRTKEAAELAGNASLTDPASRDVLTANLALAEAGTNYRAAVDALKKWLDYCPQDHTLYEQLGRYSALVGDKDGAMTAYRKALEIEPTYTPLIRYMEVVSRAEDYSAPYLVDTAALAAEAFKATKTDKYPAEVLLDQSVETVGTDGKASSTIHRVVRLLNPQGVQRFGSFSVGYTPGEQDVKVLAARVYRPDGRVDDAEVSPPRSGMSGKDEESSRIGYPISLPNPNPGDVVEFRVRLDDRKLSFFGNHYEEIFLFGDTVPVKRSEYVLITPENYPISHHVVGGEVPFTREVKDGKAIYHWRLNDVAAVVAEPSMPPLYEVVPTVFVSKFSSWEEFGKWYWSLIRDQHTADATIKGKVAEITKDKATTLEKIRAIYHYVTNDIEYVAWEFGVHGFKPYDASAVVARKFGDCKDKATLLKVMLAQIGVPSYQTLVRADSSRVRQDMTMPLFRHFNHAICYVPKGRDYPEMWLDGTAQFFPFGSFPSMDADRTVCVVEENKGGVLKNIPPMDPTINRVDIKLTMTFQQPDGEHLPTVAELNGSARGEAEAIIRANFATKPKEILERVYSRRFGECKAPWNKFPTLNNMYEPCDYSYGLDLPRITHKDGEGYAVPIFRDFLRPWNYADFVSLDKRQQVLVLGSFMDYSAIVTMVPPDGFAFAKLPQNVEINADGVRFSLTFSRDGPKVTVAEKVGIDAGRVKPADYAPFRNALLTVNQSEKQELLMLPTAASGAPADSEGAKQ